MRKVVDWKKLKDSVQGVKEGDARKEDRWFGG